MLMLSREVGQKIFINGKEIEITIVSIERGKVKIGLTAPKETVIMRAELLARMSDEVKLARGLPLTFNPPSSDFQQSLVSAAPAIATVRDAASVNDAEK